MRKSKAITKMAAIVIAVIVIIAVVAAGYYVYISGIGGQSPSPQTKVYKIAYADQDVASSTWVRLNREAIDGAAASLNTTDYPVTTTFYSDVAEANMQQLVESLCQNNYSLIILGGGFLDMCTKVLGPRYPNTQFMLQTVIFPPTDNVGAIENSGLYPGYYAGGMAAAYASKTHKIGFITAFKVPVLAGMYNGYAMGAHAVDNNTEVLVVSTEEWTNPTKGAAAADSLFGLGCDVVAAVGVEGAGTEAQSKGHYYVGYLYNNTSNAPNAVLLSVMWNPQPMYHDAIYQGLREALKGQLFAYTMAQGAAVIEMNTHLISTVLTPAQLQNVTDTVTALANGSLYVPDVETFP